MARRPSVYGGKSILKRIPAMTGGWNAKDPLASMKPGDAIVLDNWIPSTGGIDLRPGWATATTGLGAPVKSLMEYSGPTQDVLFGAAGGKIYDVSSAGAVGAAKVTGLTSDEWQHCMFATPGGQFLVISNGADAVRNYDGSTWTTPAITGVSSSTLIAVNPFAQRLFFIQIHSQSVWYLPVSSIAGAATEIPLGTFIRLGGYIVAQATWTRDGGTGSDDICVFITSKGEALLFSGTDPSSPTTWSLTGVFRLPEPIGRRCMFQSGADIGVITTKGVVSLSAVLPISISRAAQAAMTDKVKGAFQTAYRAAGAAFGWQIMEYPRGSISFVNVPQPDGTSYYQFVMNSLTNAWCRFTGIDALCWSLFGDRLYFARSDGTVCEFDTGYHDDDDPIVALALPAFSDFGLGGNKQFLMARPLYNAPAGTVPALVGKVDYDTSTPNLPIQVDPPFATPWGSPWGSPWGPAQVSIEEWQSIEGDGIVGSVYLAIAAKIKLTLQHVDVLMQPGGVL